MPSTYSLYTFDDVVNSDNFHRDEAETETAIVSEKESAQRSRDKLEPQTVVVVVGLG